MMNEHNTQSQITGNMETKEHHKYSQTNVTLIVSKIVITKINDEIRASHVAPMLIFNGK